MKEERKKVTLDLTADELMLIIHGLGELKSNESAWLFLRMRELVSKWKELPEAKED